MAVLGPRPRPGGGRSRGLGRGDLEKFLGAHGPRPLPSPCAWTSVPILLTPYSFKIVLRKNVSSMLVSWQKNSCSLWFQVILTYSNSLIKHKKIIFKDMRFIWHLLLVETHEANFDSKFPFLSFVSNYKNLTFFLNIQNRTLFWIR